MNKNKILAIAMASAMMTGTLATSAPALAADSATTTINLAVTDTTATYDLVVPATLNVTNSGYNAFTDGVTVKNLSDATGISSVDVTAESTNDWKLLDSDNHEISYMLVANDAQDTEKNTYSFTDTTNMTTETGSKIDCGVNVSDYSDAAAGNYSDTITWTAEVKKAASTASLADMFKEGAIVEGELIYYEAAKLKFECSMTNGAFEIKSLYLNGNDCTNKYIMLAMNGKPTFKFSGVLDGLDELIVDTSDNKYNIVGNNGGDPNSTLTSFKVNGTEYADKLTKNADAGKENRTKEVNVYWCYGREFITLNVENCNTWADIVEKNPGELITEKVSNQNRVSHKCHAGQLLYNTNDFNYIVDTDTYSTNISYVLYYEKE